MQIPPSYTITDEMLQIISQIDALRLYIAAQEITPVVKEKIQRNSILKSSLFSARIEGNPLDMEAMIRTEEKEKKLEVFNILKATQFIDKIISQKKKITKDFIKELHTIVLKDLSGDAGMFRKDSSAIFNQAGVAVYVPPPPHIALQLIEQLIEYMNLNSERFPLIHAFITHLVFEKIHPFIDGNGRVGRLLIVSILKKSGYDFGFFVPFEEYLDSHRDDYYYYIDNGMQDTSSYILFMLQAFYAQCEETQKTLQHELQNKNQLNLPPRQEEIFLIIKEHGVVSLDFIKRRFVKVPERTLRYDLKRLQDEKYLVKIGKTRGSYYKLLER